MNEENVARINAKNAHLEKQLKHLQRFNNHVLDALEEMKKTQRQARKQFQSDFVDIYNVFQDTLYKAVEDCEESIEAEMERLNEVMKEPVVYKPNNIQNRIAFFERHIITGEIINVVEE